jgi:hypothetical protein
LRRGIVGGLLRTELIPTPRYTALQGSARHGSRRNHRAAPARYRTPRRMALVARHAACAW